MQTHWLNKRGFLFGMVVNPFQGCHLPVSWYKAHDFTLPGVP